MLLLTAPVCADLFKYLNGALGFEKSLTGNALAAQASQPPAVQA